MTKIVCIYMKISEKESNKEEETKKNIVKIQ